MNPEPFLNAVEEAIRTREASDTNHWCICYLKSGIKCMPARTIIDEGNIFGRFSTDELNDGFTTRQWSSILCEIANYLVRKKT